MFAKQKLLNGVPQFFLFLDPDVPNLSHYIFGGRGLPQFSGFTLACSVFLSQSRVVNGVKYYSCSIHRTRTGLKITLSG